MQYLALLDRELFLAVYRGCKCSLLDSIMPALTHLGDGETVVIASLILMLLKRKEARRAGILLLAGSTLSYNALVFLKLMVARPRPFQALAGVSACTSASGFSFPSGHATLAFLTAVVCSKLFKRGEMLFIIAILIAFSRIYLGVHYPLDVMAGALLGTVLGYALNSISI